MAVCDIYSKAMDKPLWQLLGGKGREFITPYASLKGDPHAGHRATES
jgi:L-alanine-DL-glutamate epimerase-like enolase superfamily enzyme